MFFSASALCVSAFRSPLLSTSSIPQKLHSKHSASPEPAVLRCLPAPPIPPMQFARIALPVSPRTPAQSSQDRSHPTAATQETIPLPARHPRSAFRTARPPTVHSVPQPHKPPHRAHSPNALSLKTNALPPQIPDKVRAASISGYAAIQIPVSPSLKSRSDGNRPPPAPSAPSHRTLPFHLRSARPRRCTYLRPAAIPCRAGCPHQSPANKPTRAPAPAPPILPVIAASFLSFGAATPQSNQS